MTEVLPGSVLPIPDQVYTGPMVMDAKKMEESFFPSR